MVTVVNIQAPTKELEKSKAIEMIDTLRANTPDKVELANAIVRACTVYNIPVDLMTALVFTESSFRQYAVSDKLCLGYTQVNWKVHSWIDTTQVYEANYNLMCGARILREYYDINKDWNNALLRYNGVVKGSTYPAKVNNNLDKIRREAR
jgi:soluble lytic murein transglycosylase-like protein